MRTSIGRNWRVTARSRTSPSRSSRRSTAGDERTISLHRTLPVRPQDPVLPRLPADARRMSGMAQDDPISAAGNIAGMPATSGQACQACVTVALERRRELHLTPNRARTHRAGMSVGQALDYTIGTRRLAWELLPGSVKPWPGEHSVFSFRSRSIPWLLDPHRSSCLARRRQEPRAYRTR